MPAPAQRRHDVSDTKNRGKHARVLYIERDGHDPSFMANLNKLGQVQVPRSQFAPKKDNEMVNILQRRRKTEDELAEAVTPSTIHMSAGLLANLLDERKAKKSPQAIKELCKEYGVDYDVVEALAQHVNTPSISRIPLPANVESDDDKDKHLYAHRDSAVSQIAAVLDKFIGNLYHEASEFTYDDGRVELLVHLTGVLPVPIGPNTYHCPVALWLPLDFPAKPPMVFVVPSSTLAIKPGPGLDPSGRLSAPYLDNWQRKPEGCSLLALVDELIHMFSVRYPVVARTQQSPQQPPPPRSGSPPRPPRMAGSSAYQSVSRHRVDDGSRSAAASPSNGRTSSPPRPPPPPGYGSPADQAPATPPPPLPHQTPLRYDSPVSHSRSSSLTTHGRPAPPLPPAVPTPLSMSPPPSTANSLQHTHSTHQSPPPSIQRVIPPGHGTHPNGSPWHSANHQRSDSAQLRQSLGSVQRSRLSDTPQPPVESQFRRVPAHAAGRPPLPPIYPAQAGSTLSDGYESQPQPDLRQFEPHLPHQYAPSSLAQSERSVSPSASVSAVPFQPAIPAQTVSLPQQMPSHSMSSTVHFDVPRSVKTLPPSPTVSSGVSSVHAMPQRARTTGARAPRPIVNILDSDADDSASSEASPMSPSTTVISPPPIPPNPALLALRTRLHSKMTGALTGLANETQANLHQMDMYEADLLEGEPAILDEMQRLQIVRGVCENVRDRYKAIVREGEERLREYETRGDGPEPDEIVCSSTVVYNQLLDLVSEDAALEDTIYQLGRGLNTDTANIDLDKFLKRVRGLAREQFLKRAAINKILLGLAARQQYLPSTGIQGRSATPQHT
ncbi:Suppressor protein stp22 of temperature-sensitive alpha-factor receptor and arginine permease [Microbotryomycetes sp. JL201]|nr:Suppressor protein stp22 of temperature-sensitive alpha-factor receptor and arginine permease [Microbotryomycetes sp. JL201]